MIIVVLVGDCDYYFGFGGNCVCMVCIGVGYDYVGVLGLVVVDFVWLYVVVFLCVVVVY